MADFPALYYTMTLEVSSSIRLHSKNMKAIGDKLSQPLTYSAALHSSLNLISPSKPLTYSAALHSSLNLMGPDIQTPGWKQNIDLIKNKTKIS